MLAQASRSVRVSPSGGFPTLCNLPIREAPGNSPTAPEEDSPSGTVSPDGVVSESVSEKGLSLGFGRNANQNGFSTKYCLKNDAKHTIFVPTVLDPSSPIAGCSSPDSILDRQFSRPSTPAAPYERALSESSTQSDQCDNSSHHPTESSSVGGTDITGEEEFVPPIEETALEANPCSSNDKETKGPCPDGGDRQAIPNINITGPRDTPGDVEGFRKSLCRRDDAIRATLQSFDDLFIEGINNNDSVRYDSEFPDLRHPSVDSAPDTSINTDDRSGFSRRRSTGNARIVSTPATSLLDEVNAELELSDSDEDASSDSTESTGFTDSAGEEEDTTFGHSFSSDLLGLVEGTGSHIESEAALSNKYDSYGRYPGGNTSGASSLRPSSQAGSSHSDSSHAPYRAGVFGSRKRPIGGNGSAGEGDGDEDEDEETAKRPRQNPPPEFRCKFPERYPPKNDWPLRSCKKGQSYDRLREHYKRVHLKIACCRCFETFPTEEKLIKHMAADDSQRCRRRDPSERMGKYITKERWHKLRKNKEGLSGMSPEKKVQRMESILFADTDTIDTDTVAISAPGLANSLGAALHVPTAAREQNIMLLVPMSPDQRDCFEWLLEDPRRWLHVQSEYRRCQMQTQHAPISIPVQGPNDFSPSPGAALTPTMDFAGDMNFPYLPYEPSALPQASMMPEIRNTQYQYPYEQGNMEATGMTSSFPLHPSMTSLPTNLYPDGQPVVASIHASSRNASSRNPSNQTSFNNSPSSGQPRAQQAGSQNPDMYNTWNTNGSLFPF